MGLIKTIPCIFKSVRRRADRSISMTFESAIEISTEAMTEFDKIHLSDVVLAIKETCYTAKDLNDIDAIDIDIESNKKTPSQRLRGVFWILHKQELGRNPSKDEFKAYYGDRMEKIIQQLKNRIKD